jgi:hypothetical protein
MKCGRDTIEGVNEGPFWLRWCIFIITCRWQETYRAGLRKTLAYTTFTVTKLWQASNKLFTHSNHWYVHGSVQFWHYFVAMKVCATLSFKIFCQPEGSSAPYLAPSGSDKSRNLKMKYGTWVAIKNWLYRWSFEQMIGAMEFTLL